MSNLKNELKKRLINFFGFKIESSNQVDQELEKTFNQKIDEYVNKLSDEQINKILLDEYIPYFEGNYYLYGSAKMHKIKGLQNNDVKLANIEILSIHINGNSLKWINNLSNLKTLIIFLDDEFDLSEICKLPSLESVKILRYYKHDKSPIFDEKNYGFLKNAKNLKELSLCDFIVDPNFLSSLTQLKKITLTRSNIKNINYDKLIFLRELEYNEYDGYALNKDEYLSTYMSNRNILKLKTNGVKLNFDIQKVVRTNIILSKINSSLELDGLENKEKINRIIDFLKSLNVNSDDNAKAIYELISNNYPLTNDDYENLFIALANNAGLKALTENKYDLKVVKITNNNDDYIYSNDDEYKSYYYDLDSFKLIGDDDSLQNYLKTKQLKLEKKKR